jgi:hypothetical protein
MRDDLGPATHVLAKVIHGDTGFRMGDVNGPVGFRDSERDRLLRLERATGAPYFKRLLPIGGVETGGIPPCWQSGCIEILTAVGRRNVIGPGWLCQELSVLNC